MTIENRTALVEVSIPYYGEEGGIVFDAVLETEIACPVAPQIGMLLIWGDYDAEHRVTEIHWLVDQERYVLVCDAQRPPMFDDGMLEAAGFKWNDHADRLVSAMLSDGFKRAERQEVGEDFWTGLETRVKP